MQRDRRKTTPTKCSKKNVAEKIDVVRIESQNISLHTLQQHQVTYYCEAREVPMMLKVPLQTHIPQMCRENVPAICGQ